MSMLRSKSILTVLTLAVVVGHVPTAFGAVRLVIAGSSALFQTVSLGAYNGGTAIADGVGTTAHWSSKNANFNLQDSRVTPVNNDAAQITVVWDSATSVDFWIFAKVDSGVGDRCFFAVPACELVDISGNNAGWTSNAQQLIGTALWGQDVTTLPQNVLDVVETSSNTKVNVAATDIRPEDAWWTIGRVNSSLGASVASNGNSDNLDGLGYNSNNAAGEIPNYVTSTTGTCTKLAYANAVGTPVYSAFQHTGTSTDAANVLAWNLYGKDPISCTAIPTYEVKTVGIAPVVFVFSRYDALSGLSNATEQQLQQVFSGTSVNASAFGLTAGSINAFLREPISGTYGATEADVMRNPTLYSSGTIGLPVEGLSMETGVGQPTAGNAPGPNPLSTGNRWRAIQTSEEIASVQCSANDTGSKCGGAYSNTSHVDGIGFTFFSYGNVSPLADSTAYGYITLDGVDPIFLSYQGGGNASGVGVIDPGQPLFSTYGAYGVLPGSSEVTYPVCETSIWKYGQSFPNVRNGTYHAWSALRLAYASTNATAVTDLVAASNAFAVDSVPDYAPVTSTTVAAGTGGCAAKVVDPGVLVWRSHYQQRDGAGNPLGKTVVNTNTADAGGDMGGAILIYESNALGVPELTTQLVQSTTSPNVGPAIRPAQ
jgi:hypothetical protein